MFDSLTPIVLGLFRFMRLFLFSNKIEPLRLLFL